MTNPKIPGGKSEKISCDVKNCVFHAGASGCAATKINVGSENASKCDQTSCNTFKDKNTGK